jgi:hypothetical protein
MENGEIKEIAEEMENSVNFYRMQSMNQSLIALLAHNRITYDQACEASCRGRRPVAQAPQDVPEHRRTIQGGHHGTIPRRLLADHRTPGDQAPVRRSRRAQQGRRSQEKDEIIASLEREVADLRQTMDQSSGSEDEMRRRLETSQAEVQRVKDEAASKINALNERIRDLNQRLSQQGGGGGKPTTGGFFKR